MSGKEAREQSELDNSHIKVINFVMMMVMMVMMVMMMMMMIMIIIIIILIIIINGSRTEWSPIRSVIVRVINKIERPRSGCLIFLITSMITDRIGRHEVLLPINHNFNKICDIIGYFLNQNTRNSKFCFASSEKKSHLSARVMARTVQLLRHDAYCPIKLSN